MKVLINLKIMKKEDIILKILLLIIMTKINNNIILFSIVLVIIFFGFFLMYSASSSFANYRFNKSDTYFLSKHFVWLLIGFSAMLFCSLTNHYLFRKYAKIILYLSWVVMLIPIFSA